MSLQISGYVCVGFVIFVILVYALARAAAMGYFRTKAEYERRRLNLKGDRKDVKGQ